MKFAAIGLDHRHIYHMVGGLLEAGATCVGFDPATSDGLPAFLIGNEDGTESGYMIVQYTAAAIVNDLASRAMPASVYSIPTSANAEDHVSMGANETRHVLAMANDLGEIA